MDAELVGPDPEVQADSEQRPSRRQRRPKRRALCCPAHPEQLIEGNGRKYFLHLLTPEQLKQRGMSDKKARLVIGAYPVLVLSNEWLEELFCPQCGMARWCYVVRHDRVQHSVRWAPRELWEQVAHVDPVQSNPTVSEFTRREARRHRQRREDGKKYFDKN
ncbi:MAG: hypothetical protein R6W06_01345 [Prochlorococcaceae cyanobacterium]